MEIDKDLIEVYNILAEKKLENFFTAFYLQLHINKIDDLFNICLDDLHRVGIISKLCVKSFVDILADIKRNRSSKQDSRKTDECLQMFTVNSMLIKQDPVIISAQDIQYKEALGEGHFGKVFKGLWQRRNAEDKKGINIPVAIKSLTDGSEMSWKKEVAIFTTLNQNHPCIIKFFGLLISDEDEVKMVSEFAALGSLLDRLRAKNITSISTLSQFAVQIASGMVFLHSKNLVHRDLSARNILVIDKHQVKISDFGLSKVLSESEHEWVMDSNEMLPMRWLSPESYNNGVFTTASDVWSFAVVLWEMFTLGDIPWGSYNNDQVVEKIQTGTPLPEPNLCPHGIYEVMLICLCKSAESRPPFHVIRDELMSQQPETLLTLCEEVGNYNLNFKKNEYVTAIKNISQKDPQIWLGQHETTLLFGTINLSATTTIEYELNSHDNDQNENMVRRKLRDSKIRNDTSCEKENRKNAINVQHEDLHKSTSTSSNLNGSPEDDREASMKASDCVLYGRHSPLPPVEIKKETSPSQVKVRPRSAVVPPTQHFVERTIELNNLKSDSDSKIMFKDTSPVVQDTVNDRIAHHMKAFVDFTELKPESYSQENEYLVPVVVSTTKPSLDSVINSVDPFPRTKSSSHENIYEEIDSLITKRSQSTEMIAQGSTKRPRPKPQRSNLVQQNVRDSYAESVKKDFDRFSESIKKPSPKSMPLPDELNERLVSTSQLTHTDVRNQEYLKKFSHVVLPNATTPSNGKVPYDSHLKGAKSDPSHHRIRCSPPTGYSDFVPQNYDSKPKHFTYDAKAAEYNTPLTSLPVSVKERTKRSVTNYTSNNWHLFDDCVKDTKRAEKLRKSEKNKANEISWPSDMSKLSQNKKEEFSDKFQKIRLSLPDASVSDCLEGLRYSRNDVKRAIQYIQVLKLTRYNFGFTFDHCEKTLDTCKGDLVTAEKVVKLDYVCDLFKLLDREQVKELLEVSEWNVNNTVTTIFVQNCNEIGITVQKAKTILVESDHNVIKALEMAKIVRLSEITSKPEHLCFRALTHCRWKIERAVDYIFTKYS